MNEQNEDLANELDTEVSPFGSEDTTDLSDDGGDSMDGLLAMLRGDQPTGPEGFSITAFGESVMQAFQTALGAPTDEVVGGANVGAVIEYLADLTANLAADHDQKAGAAPGTSLKLIIDTATESYKDYIANGGAGNEKVNSDLAKFG